MKHLLAISYPLLGKTVLLKDYGKEFFLINQKSKNFRVRNGQQTRIPKNI